MPHPGAAVIGHPFNPRTIPLVEVVGGGDRARNNRSALPFTRRSASGDPIRREVAGHFANRLQARCGARRCISLPRGRQLADVDTGSARAGAAWH